MKQEITVTKSRGDQVHEMQIGKRGRTTTLKIFYDNNGNVSQLKTDGAALPLDALLNIATRKTIIEIINDIASVTGTIMTQSSRPIFTWEKILRDGLDAHWDAKEHPSTGGGKYGDIAVPASKWWIQENYATPWNGSMICPASLGGTTWYSRSAFRYPHIVFNMTLPTITGFPVSPDNVFGFENGRDWRGGLACFRWIEVGGAEVMRLFVRKLGTAVNVDVTALLPATAKTAMHTYEVYVGKNVIEFLIDEVLIGVGVNTGSYTGYNQIAGPPYALFESACGIPASMTAIIELATGGGQALISDLSPINVRVTEGSPVRPRIYYLRQWQSTTAFVGSVIAAGSLTCHPVPIFGYTQKTLYFQADQAGSMVVEVFLQSGRWQTLESVAIVANTLKQYNINGQGLFARITFTPGAFPCTVWEAEAELA